MNSVKCFKPAEAINLLHIQFFFVCTACFVTELSFSTIMLLTLNEFQPKPGHLAHYFADIGFMSNFPTRTLYCRLLRNSEVFILSRFPNSASTKE